MWYFLLKAALSLAAIAVLAWAEDFRPPAGARYAIIGSSASILPGGRILRPLGRQLPTGPGPLGLAVSKNGTIATADTARGRFGITVIEPSARGPWRERHIRAEGKGVSRGIVFDDSAKAIWVSEGDSGRIREIDLNSGDTRKTVNVGGFTGDFAWDSARRLIYVINEAEPHSRVVTVDAKAGRVLSSVEVSPQPFAIALSPDAAAAYVTKAGAVCAIDVRDAMKPAIMDCVSTNSPRAVIATADHIFVSNARSDSITVISPQTHQVETEIPLRIPSLESWRGIAPAGMAYDPVTKWLLVAESEINAIGIVDTEKNRLIGHIPAGRQPARVAISGDRVYVANVLGRGAGPNDRPPILELGDLSTRNPGSVTTFLMPDESEVLVHTATVFANNGFVPWMNAPRPPPDGIRHVVLIAKGGEGGHTFDELLGDVAKAGNGEVLASPRLARLGMHGVAAGGKFQFSVQDAAITPNQHALAQKWSFSDNFYADGGRPGVLGDSFRKFDEAGSVSDQTRVDRFIADLERAYRHGAEPLPALLYLSLPNDSPPPERTDAGHAYEASWVEDNDFALGRVLDYLSHSPWWREMTVLVTENGTGGDLDHIDSARTILLAAGPYVKRNYVSHTNANFPGLMRTIAELLRLRPRDLTEATAASLGDLFTDEADFTPYTARSPDPRIYAAPTK